MQIIQLEETPSTNTWLREHAAELGHGTIVTTGCQSAGRGQRGNSWESEPGKNLTLSILVRPAGIPAVRQMAISRAVSLAIVDWLDGYLPDGMTASIKWPNDIYVGDRKICGILIEHALTGTGIDRTIIGVGINVNQEKFLSDAPNPVSLIQLTCREHQLGTMLAEVGGQIISRIESEMAASGLLTESEYASRLWRREGFHPYRDADGEFMAEIAGVAPDGMLTLRRSDGTTSSYAFKEVQAIIKS